MSLSENPGQWKAGVATVDITPAQPIFLAGWGARTEPSKGFSQRIFAKSLALEDSSGETHVFLTSDLLGYSRAMSESIAAQISQIHGLERRQLILNASHNHSGPVIEGVLPLYYPGLDQKQRQYIEQYTNDLHDRLIEVIGKAINSLAAAELAFEQGLAGFAVNRRRARPNKRSLPGVVDHDVPVLSVHADSGQLRAVVFGYACHATALEDGKINGDYPGYAQAWLEQMHPGATAMFVTGCGGDANPLPRFQPGLCESYGHTLACAVDEVLAAPMKPIIGSLRSAFHEAELPFEPVPTREQLLAMLPGREGIRKDEVENLLAILDRGQALPLVCACPIHVWRIGDELKLIAVTGELVADYALRFKQSYGWDDVWVAGYNNEFLSYVPSKRVLLEGGYEGTDGMMECGHPAPFTADVEEIIADNVHQLLQQCRQ